MTILCDASSYTKQAMIREIEQEEPEHKSIPIYLSRYGLRAWECEGCRD